MKNFIEASVYGILCKIFDLVILNLLYLCSCIPLVTIGAASTALYTSVFSLLRDDARIPAVYLRSFCKSLKISTLPWLLEIIVAVVICADFCIVALYWTTPGKYLLLGLLLLCFFLLLATSYYLFPMLGSATFEKIPISTAFILSTKHLPRTILICLVNLIPTGLLLFWTYGFMLLTWFFLLIGFSLRCYIVCLLLKNVFAPILSEEHFL